MVNSSIGFNQALEMLIQGNPTKKPEFLRDELISGILSGEITMANNSQLDEFYHWCKQHVDPNKDASSPLNWINLFLYSSMADQLKSIDTPGLPHMLKAMKESRVGKNFDFVLHPDFLKKSYLDKFKKSGLLFLSFNSKLRFKNNEFYFLLNNNYKILMKFCWIIIKDNKHE